MINTCGTWIFMLIANIWIRYYIYAVILTNDTEHCICCQANIILKIVFSLLDKIFESDIISRPISNENNKNLPRMRFRLLMKCKRNMLIKSEKLARQKAIFLNEKHAENSTTYSWQTGATLKTTAQLSLTQIFKIFSWTFSTT